MARRQRVEEVMLSGPISPSLIAVQFGISEKDAECDINAIRKRWRDNQEDLSDLRIRRCMQLEKIYTMSLNSFRLSQKGPLEDQTSKDICKRCEGEGKEEDMPGKFIVCQECDGEGMIESTSQVHKALPGDPKYLKISADIVKELMKVDGMYPVGQNNATNIQINAASVGGEIAVEVQELFAGGNQEALLKAQQLLAISQKKPKKNAPEVQAIESTA